MNGLIKLLNISTKRCPEIVLRWQEPEEEAAVKRDSSKQTSPGVLSDASC